MIKLPYPPLEMVKRIGHTNYDAFDNPTGQRVFPELESFSVLDIGCGCGRLARQFLQQNIPPRYYLGIDINLEMVQWCQANIVNPPWEFYHSNVHNRALNPNGKLTWEPIPSIDGVFTLAVAWSLFTHVLETEVVKNLSEVSRCLASGRYLVSTWFLFEKKGFPFMQEFQNALYINLEDPINAVVYDQAFVASIFTAAGLVIRKVVPPAVRGHQWVIYAEKSTEGVHISFPEDMASFGLARPPVSEKEEN